MKCLRCGYCCKNMCVVIIDDPSKGVIPGNFAFHSGDGTPCKHLVGDIPGKYSCSIHNYEWYDQTPCFDFDQLPISKDIPCRLGLITLKKRGGELQ